MTSGGSRATKSVGCPRGRRGAVCAAVGIELGRTAQQGRARVLFAAGGAASGLHPAIPPSPRRRVGNHPAALAVAGMSSPANADCRILLSPMSPTEKASRW